MALLSSSSKGVVISLPVLVLTGAAFSAVLLFFLFSSPPPPAPCNCLVTPTTTTVAAVGGSRSGAGERISTTIEDIEWVKEQIEGNGLHMADNVLRKGINPRTRQQQLQDLLQYETFPIYVSFDLAVKKIMPLVWLLVNSVILLNFMIVLWFYWNLFILRKY